MKIAHLILTHKNPQQLLRLIHALQHPSFDFYIHIDRKKNLREFTSVIESPNIYWINKRAKINWAGYGTIQATLNGFYEIIPKNYAYINVISGQDFPLKPASYIYHYITSRKDREFITCESIEDEWKEAAIRVKDYHLVDWNIPGKYGVARLLTWMLPKRKFPLDYKIVGRANWFTLTSNASQYILDFIGKNPKFIRYFKLCWGADEFFFATILYNSVFKSKIENNLVYVDWNVPEKNGHPKILGIDDYQDLISSPKLFARKFDITKDSKIIELLESYINQTV